MKMGLMVALALAFVVLVNFPACADVLREGAVACYSEAALNRQMDEIGTSEDPSLIDDCVLADASVEVIVESSVGYPVVIKEPMTGWVLYTVPQYLD